MLPLHFNYSIFAAQFELARLRLGWAYC